MLTTVSSIEIDSRYKNKYQVSDKEKVDKDTGTCVEISQIEGLTKDSMESIELKQVLLNNFSWYLFLKKEYGYKIILNGKELQYSELINEELSEEITININQYSFNIFFINWKENVNSKFFFLIIFVLFLICNLFFGYMYIFSFVIFHFV